MRKSLVVLALGASILCAASASAAAPTANILFAGTIRPDYGQDGAALCVFDGKQSTYMRKTLPAARLISFPDIMIAPNGSVAPTYYTVGGQGRLEFNQGDLTSGRIDFVPVAGNLPGVNRPRFNLYKEDYDSATGILTVSFRIVFPNCVLGVVATYRN